MPTHGLAEWLDQQTSIGVGPMIPSDPDRTLTKARQKLGVLVPAGSVIHDGFIELPSGASPRDVVLAPSVGDDSESYRYLRRVFEHCAPQCAPLPDMLGLCTQVDNLIAGYRISLGLMPDPATPSLPRR